MSFVTCARSAACVVFKFAIAEILNLSYEEAVGTPAEFLRRFEDV